MMLAQFAVVWQARALLIDGFLETLWLSAISAVASIALGALLAMALMARNRAVAIGC